MHNKSILLASRAETVGAFIRYVLETRGDRIVAGVRDEGALEAQLALFTPDIILMETTFKGLETSGYIGELTEGRRGLRVVVFALEECQPRRAAIFISRGADSFVCFRLGFQEVWKAMDRITGGQTYLPRDVQRAVDERDVHPVARGALTVREREVGRLIAAGYTVRDIAVRLGLSTKTVESHRTHIYGKTDCRRRSDFVAYALHAGLLEQEEACISA